MANLFLPQLITWFRLDEHVKRLKGRVDALESNPGIQSVSGDLVNNTDPLNPTIIDAPEDGNQYARQDGAWTEVEAGGVAQLKNYTVGTLPVGTEGDTAYVTDATAPTYLGALVGGGAVKCPVFFNGTIWVSH